MKVLVTGAAGFIGRWVCKQLLGKGYKVTALDNLSNGRRENIAEFESEFEEFIEGDIKDKKLIDKLFKRKFDICYHLAASIIVQESIDTPEVTFANDVIGTFNVLEAARANKTKVLFMSTCMVYDMAGAKTGINEFHPTKPASPYAAFKLSGEQMVISYYYTYGLPTTVIRPFNTYGPFQKCTGEGGVVAIFVGNELKGKDICIYGDGTQTRDLLYVEDCARFVIAAGENKKCEGKIVNAGSGRDISVNDLASLICKNPDKIKHVKHIHPQSEIPKLLCDYSYAKKLLGWEPKVSLEEGIEKVRNQLKIKT
ncbi:SDR family NAD(P)-dependent oxidoreductase [bacterium]|nr:SDR family NAD(P)-dependent oxidoreductase [bacterium]